MRSLSRWIAGELELIARSHDCLARSARQAETRDFHLTRAATLRDPDASLLAKFRATQSF